MRRVSTDHQSVYYIERAAIVNTGICDLADDWPPEHEGASLCERLPQWLVCSSVQSCVVSAVRRYDVVTRSSIFHTPFSSTNSTLVFNVSLKFSTAIESVIGITTEALSDFTVYVVRSGVPHDHFTV